jgi:hypothetical protein
VIIDRDTLNTLLLHAFSGKTTWIEASTRYPVDDFVDSFYATRALMQRTIADIDDAVARFISPVHPFWSISETITHLIYSQGFYHNKLLDIATSQMPHVLEAARGFGEGARPGLPAATLRELLQDATGQIATAIEGTRNAFEAERVEYNTFFGECTYKTWMLLLLGHEVDHVRQATLVRRLARREGEP